MSERINLSVPARGKAHLTFDVGTEKSLDITLIYTQDITGTFLPQFRAFTEIENPAWTIVLPIISEDRNYLIVSKKELTYIIDETTKELYVCEDGAADLILTCIDDFEASDQDWANFDIVDDASSIGYARDVANRIALIHSSVTDIRPYFLRI